MRKNLSQIAASLARYIFIVSWFLLSIMIPVNFCPTAALAGPPFFTDDPEPVELNHWEVYIASAYSHSVDGTQCTAPHTEVNFGAFPDTQLHLIIPTAYSHPHELGRHYGLGDLELGVKYRFIREDEKGWRPQVGTFPIVELPTGNSKKGLGEGHMRAFFPVWFQKSWGPWTTYGGGGYCYHPGEDNKNFWFAGWLLQREFSRMLTIGAEVFNSSPKAKGERDETGFNIGGIVNLSDEHHILFSAGRDFKGPNNLFAYLAFQWTLGPKEEKKAE